MKMKFLLLLLCSLTLMTSCSSSGTQGDGNSFYSYNQKEVIASLTNEMSRKDNKGLFFYSNLNGYEFSFPYQYYSCNTYNKFGGPLISTYYLFDMPSSEVISDSNVNIYTSYNCYDSLDSLDIKHFKWNNISINKVAETILPSSGLTSYQGEVVYNKITLGKYSYTEPSISSDYAYDYLAEVLLSSLTLLIVK